MYKCPFCDLGIMLEACFIDGREFVDHHYMICDHSLCYSNKESIGMWVNETGFNELELWEHS